MFRTSFCLVLAATATQAAEPNIQTPSPVIFLAENFDEAQNLGWCIDTVGRGFAEVLHAHSCKPQGGDVQFSFEDNGQIKSVAFPNVCMSFVGLDQSFALIECNADEAAQKFSYDPATGQIEIGTMASHCVAVGATSRSAGPFMSRDLIAESCAADNDRMSWVVRR